VQNEDPNDGVARQLLEDGRQHWASGNYDEAMLCYGMAERVDPDNPDVKEALGLGWAALGTTATASHYDEDGIERGMESLIRRDTTVAVVSDEVMQRRRASLIEDHPFHNLRATTPNSPFAPPAPITTARERRQQRERMLKARRRRVVFAWILVTIVSGLALLGAGVVRYSTSLDQRNRQNTISGLSHALETNDLSSATTLLDQLRETQALDQRTQAEDSYFAGRVALLQGDAKAAIPLLHEATIGLPERGDFRLSYARALNAGGRQRDAGQQYEDAFTKWGDPAMWLEYADFLRATNKPDIASGIYGLLVTNGRKGKMNVSAVQVALALGRLGQLAVSHGQISEAGPYFAAATKNLALADTTLLRDYAGYLRASGRPTDAAVLDARAAALATSLTKRLRSPGAKAATKVHHG
jgi:cytochrome c-type biogenesis protein CcmH/NrfG